MKTVKTTAMALTIAVLAVSCGGGNKKRSATDETGKVEAKGNDYANQKMWTELTATDWQKVVKKNYDFDLTVPQGWAFKEGKKTNVNPAYELDFSTGADDFTTALKSLHQFWFDLTEKITPADGNFNIDFKMIENEKGETIGRKDVKGKRIAELTKAKWSDTLDPELWYFNTPKGAVQFTLNYSEKAKLVRVSLVYMSKLE